MEEVQGRVELKYCERCGGLWLRPSLCRSAYCRRCEQQMRELPFAGYRKSGVRGEREYVLPGVLQASGKNQSMAGGAF